MRFKGIIFDFNGVLLWDTQWHADAWHEASKIKRGTPLTQEEWDRLKGRTNREFWPAVLKRELSNSEIDELAEFKEAMYRDIARSQGRGFALSPGAQELLDEILRGGIPHTIATSSESGNVDFFVKNLDLGRWFDTNKIVYDDGTVLGKPAPDLYVKAAEKLSLPTSKCVVIEDSRSGIEAAKRAGIGKIIALGPKEGHSELQAWGADQVVESLKELSVSDF